MCMRYGHEKAVRVNRFERERVRKERRNNRGGGVVGGLVSRKNG
jgi:hypothetical protein